MGQPINDAEVFDFASRKWTMIHRMPTKRAASKAAIVREGKIIIVGGVTEKQAALRTVDCYNIGANTWEAFPPLPVGVTGPYVELIDDKIYCIGGTDKKGPKGKISTNQSVVYDFDKRQWLPLPAKPTPCYACGGYFFDRKLFIIGGRDGPEPVQAVEAFDVDTQQWEKCAPMNAVRVFYSVVGIKDEIYVIGGLVPMVGICKVVEKYSIHEDMWARIKDLSEIRSDSAQGIVGNRVVVTGGLGGEKLRAMATGECIGYRGKRFAKLPETSKERSSVTSLNFEGKLAVLNGVGEGGPQKMVEVLSAKKDKSV